MEPDTRKTMTDQEKQQYARETKSAIHSNLLWAEQRSSAVSDEFIRLEVQIATILFAFASLFLTQLNPSGVDVPLRVLEIPILMKLSFVFSIFCLLVSLACGLLHLKTQERFWDSVLTQRVIRYHKWCEVNLKRTELELAEAFQDGTSMGLGKTIYTPSWAWILQTICLGLGILVLFILMIVYLFS